MLEGLSWANFNAYKRIFNENIYENIWSIDHKVRTNHNAEKKFNLFHKCYLPQHGALKEV